MPERSTDGTISMATTPRTLGVNVAVQCCQLSAEVAAISCSPAPGLTTRLTPVTGMPPDHVFGLPPASDVCTAEYRPALVVPVMVTGSGHHDAGSVSGCTVADGLMV